MKTATRPAFSVASKLIEEAGRLFGIDPIILFRKGQGRKQCMPRFAVIWTLRQMGSPRGYHNPYSYPRLARLLGFDDHSSVWHGYRRAEELRQSDPLFRAVTNELLALAVTLGPQVQKAA